MIFVASMKRIRKQSIFFSQLVSSGKRYRDRTRYEHELAKCFETFDDGDEMELEQKIMKIFHRISCEGKKRKKLSDSEKYHLYSVDRVLYKMFKLEKQNKRIVKKRNHFVSQTSSIDADDIYQKITTDISDIRMKEIELKQVLLSRILDVKAKKELDYKTFDELCAIVDLVNEESRDICGNERVDQILLFANKEKKRILCEMIAFELVLKENPDMMCPITHCLMTDPVTTINNFNYERDR